MVVHGPIAPPTLTPPGRMLFLALAGSHAYGLATDTSDADWRGVFQLPSEHFLGMWGAKMRETHEDKVNEVVLWELAHFLRLVYQGNPNIIELLWLPEENRYTVTPVIEALIANRAALFTDKAARSHLGWVTSELTKVHASGALIVSAKDLSHLPRLLWQVQSYMDTGTMAVPLDAEKRRTLRAIRSGEMEYWAAVRLAKQLNDEVHAQTVTYPFPHPDDAEEFLDELCLAARRGEYDLALPSGDG